MSDSPVEILEIVLGPRITSTGGLTCLLPLESHTKFNALKGDDA